MQWLAEFLISVILGFVWWFLLFPVVWLVSLPFILLIAIFRRGRYSEAVRDMFSGVHHFWSEWGILLVP